VLRELIVPAFLLWTWFALYKFVIMISKYNRSEDIPNTSILLHFAMMCVGPVAWVYQKANGQLVYLISGWILVATAVYVVTAILIAARCELPEDKAASPTSV
jgi:hypothetical protein